MEPDKDEESQKLLNYDMDKKSEESILAEPISEEKDEFEIFSAAEVMYPSALSLSDRLTHAILYMIGAVFYFSAAIYSLPYDMSMSRSGWLLTIGSVFFEFASCQMYYVCSFQQKQATEGDKEEVIVLLSILSFEDELNSGLSQVGNILNIIGSIMLIPATNLFVFGEYLFLVGSALVFVSSFIRIYRLGLSNSPQERIFDFSNYVKYPLILVIEFSMGVNGFFFSWTSLYFLTRFLDIRLGADLYSIGGCFAILAGFLLFYKQICMHDNKLQSMKSV